MIEVTEDDAASSCFIFKAWLVSHCATLEEKSLDPIDFGFDRS
jgi:hypothetical protein